MSSDAENRTGWRDGMQTACVVLISMRASAEADAVDAEARGYPVVAAEYRMQARVCADVEAVLRRRMAEAVQ